MFPSIPVSPYQPYLDQTANSIHWPVLAIYLSIIDTSLNSSDRPTYTVAALDSLFLNSHHGAPPAAEPKEKSSQGVDRARSSCHGPGGDLHSLGATEQIEPTTLASSEIQSRAMVALEKKMLASRQPSKIRSAMAFLGSGQANAMWTTRAAPRHTLKLSCMPLF